MLEVVVLFVLGQKIKKLAEERNVKSTPWVLRMVGMWFGIEIIVVVLGLKYMGVEKIEDPSALIVLAVPAMFLAFIATWFLVVNRLKNMPQTNVQEIEEPQKPNLDHFR
ncbi:MAG: hypothetical protein LRY27_01490 [Chitinophagales bacterium]|nr:hypothetical protein [Chitinophagales bacterium]